MEIDRNCFYYVANKLALKGIHRKIKKMDKSIFKFSTGDCLNGMVFRVMDSTDTIMSFPDSSIRRREQQMNYEYFIGTMAAMMKKYASEIML